MRRADVFARLLSIARLSSSLRIRVPPCLPSSMLVGRPTRLMLLALWKGIRMRKAIPLYPFQEVWNGASINKSDWHFHQRLLERYGIVLRPTEYSQLHRKTVIEGRGLVKHKGRTRIHRVFVESAQDTIVVLVGGGRMLTAMPRSTAKRK